MTALAISAELAERVASWRSHHARHDLAAAFEAGSIETLPASVRHSAPPPQSAWHHLQRGRRRTQRSPDRQRSYERRHRLAWSGPLPGFLAGRLTISDMAVARIIADEHLRRKFCDLPIDAIAARAGTCRKTAKRALSRFRGLGLVTIEERPIKGRKSLTNVVRVVSREWLCWLEKRPPASRRSDTGGHLAAPTNTNNKKVDNQREVGAIRRTDGWRRHPPLQEIWSP